jgi:multisubunit Na+/H+ antiporter MnhC subunit
MTEQNVRLIILLTACVALISVNVIASFLKVPIGTATIADAVAALIALAGLLIKGTPPGPPPPGLHA